MLFLWYKSTNTDAARRIRCATSAAVARSARISTQFACFNGTKVQILTRLRQMRDKRRRRKEREKQARNQRRIDLKIDIAGDQLETQVLR